MARRTREHRGFGTIRRLPRARSGRLITVHFYSRALHRRTDYLAYLPPGYRRTRRYPVYYLLHGAPGAPQAFISVAGLDVRLINRLSEKRLHPMILVFADGRVKGDTFSDSEWANTPTGHFESYVVDVVHNVDHRFATIRSRQARVIGGYSAGAYGALNIALHQLPTFANVQSWSGYFTQTHNGVFAHATRATMVYNSPLAFARLPFCAVRLQSTRCGPTCSLDAATPPHRRSRRWRASWVVTARACHTAYIPAGMTGRSGTGGSIR